MSEVLRPPDVAVAQGGPSQRATARFMLRHPARWVALGFGSGLSPWAPGTAGTLWAWAVFLALSPVLSDRGWAWLIGMALLVGVWACARTARDLGVADPSSIVWDEVVGFWLVLWVFMPASWVWQLWAFLLFRVFDAVKPGPVGWADRLCKGDRGQPIGWIQGVGILLDDLVAAGCTLLTLAVAVSLGRAGSFGA